MKIETRNFPSIMKDNDVRYLSFMEAILNSVDELASVEAVMQSNGVSVRLAPSHPKYNKSLLQAIKDAHYFLGLRVEFSKSIKTSKSINYLINSEE